MVEIHGADGRHTVDLADGILGVATRRPGPCSDVGLGMQLGQMVVERLAEQVGTVGPQPRRARLGSGRFRPAPHAHAGTSAISDCPASLHAVGCPASYSVAPATIEPFPFRGSSSCVDSYSLLRCSRS